MSRVSDLLKEHKNQQKAIADAKKKFSLQQKELKEKQAELRANLSEQKDIQKYRNDYDHLRKQLTLVEADLKNAYERYQKSIDPEFLKKRELEFIRKKLEKLKKARDNVMRLLKREYNIRTKCNNVSYKLHQTNNEYINTQNTSIKNNKKNIDKVNETIQYKDRLVGINNYNVNNIDRRINIAITVLIVIVISLIPTILAFINVIPGKLALISIVVFAIVGITIISLKFKKVSNRSKRIWELRNYKEPADKKIAEDVVAEEESLGEDGIDDESGNTIEDILAAKLRNSEKCK